MARAAENQVVLVSANQTGSIGGLRFLGHAKVVGPGGRQLARTGAKAGSPWPSVDVDAEVARARRVLTTSRSVASTPTGRGPSLRNNRRRAAHDGREPL